MKLQLKVAFISLIILIWFQTVLCGEISNSSATIKWTCTCSSNQRIQSNVLLSNCSNSCNCSLAAGANGDRWTCLCSDTVLPKIASEGQDATCFTACNCSAGALNDFQASRRHTSSSKVVVVVLLLCITLTIIAFASSIICYFYRKEKCPNDASVLSSEKTLSCNSATNLISNRTSVPETKVDVSSPINPFTGCFYKARFLFHGKPETIRGTIFQFSYFELEYATDNFSNSNLIGLGGSSYVYRGQLRDGRTVAIKRLKDHDGPDADSLFSKEVDLLSRLNHCHVVPMLGYCSELQGKHVERLLVFEYIQNGNLRDCLDSAQGENMNWETRVSIATGAARGLEYLHEAAAPRILHRDVKSTNILLDENWRAKITDLGMAKYLKADGLVSCSGSPARMQGTFGYFAPEYAIVGRASLKSDVFSFGVVLLELITGRQPIHRSSNKGEESLVIWATQRLQDSRRVISELPDPRLKGNFPEEEMHIMAYLAKECLLLDPDARPTMSEVVQILSTIAPDNSRMRNIHAGLYQWSSFNLSKAETNSEGLDIQIKHPIEAEEPWKVSSSRWPTPCPPTDLEAPPISESNGKEAVRLSSEHIERLILLSSKARSWRTLDEETVDLVEPRFESFCTGNFKFS